MTSDIASVEEVVRQLDAVFLPHEADRLVRESAIALLSALEKDALRYRYLRSDQEKDFIVQQTHPQAWSACNGQYMDEEVDRAIDLARGAT